MSDATNKRKIDNDAPAVDSVQKTRIRVAPDDGQSFDAVCIETVPRYKTSELSGDMWRISARTTLAYKGVTIATRSYQNVADAARGLDALMAKNQYDAKLTDIRCNGNKCDQEGCANDATRVYKLKRQFCHCGAESDPCQFSPRPLIRQFCVAHSSRGDCALEDADRNYEVLEGGAPAPPPAGALSPSAFGGVIMADQLVEGLTEIVKTQEQTTE